MDPHRELDLLRRVGCATVLEVLPPPWKLDARESTRGHLKYRRGEGEIILVNHDGRGWWDPTSGAKGDVFGLVQHLRPDANFGEVRKILRPLAGVPQPSAAERVAAARGLPPEALDPARGRDGPAPPPAERWARKPALAEGTPAWAYLAGERGLPAGVLRAAAAADAVRVGAYGSAWFAHRDDAGRITHVEGRGPGWRGALEGGDKALFRLAGGPDPRRLAVAEAPIDALSLAALEAGPDGRPRRDTLYLATGGGIGPGTERALAALASRLAGRRGAILLAATDDDRPGDAMAARLGAVASAAGLAHARLRPGTDLVAGPGIADWNDALRSGRAAVPARAAVPGDVGAGSPEERASAAAALLRTAPAVTAGILAAARRALAGDVASPEGPARDPAALDAALVLGANAAAARATPGTLLAGLWWASGTPGPGAPGGAGEGGAAGPTALLLAHAELLRRAGARLDWGAVGPAAFRAALGRDLDALSAGSIPGALDAALAPGLRPLAPASASVAGGAPTAEPAGGGGPPPRRSGASPSP